jgi:hypothetical protein
MSTNFKNIKMMKIKTHWLIFVVLLILVSNSLFSMQIIEIQEDEFPTRIILNLSERPENNQAVTWCTNIAVSNSQAQIVIANETNDLTTGSKLYTATTDSVYIDSIHQVFYHSVVFDSLLPNTVYAYRVGSNKCWSEWNQFITAKDKPEAFKFIYFGDVQNNISSMCSRVFRTAYKKVPDAAFWHFVGDIVGRGYDPSQWGEFYDALGWITRTIPFTVLPGNHEYYTRIDSVKSLTLQWHKQFTLPENGPNELKEEAYYIDYQGVRLVQLNTNKQLKEQAEWLDSILNKNPQRWTIVSTHHSAYSTGRDRDPLIYRNLFIPIFEKHSVDIVLQGHDHNYARTFKLNSGKKVSDSEEGIVYVTSVVGTKDYQLTIQNKEIFAKVGTGRQLFQVISIDNNSLLLESFNATGELYDSFIIEK